MDSGYSKRMSLRQGEDLPGMKEADGGEGATLGDTVWSRWWSFFCPKEGVGEPDT